MTKSFERIALPELQIPMLAVTQPKDEPSKADSSKDESSKGTSYNYIHNLSLKTGDFEGKMLKISCAESF